MIQHRQSTMPSWCGQIVLLPWEAIADDCASPRHGPRAELRMPKGQPNSQFLVSDRGISPLPPVLPTLFTDHIEE